MTFTRILTLSRPHFWLYEFGTFLLGAVVAASAIGQLFTLEVLIWGFYFLFPANLLIYGINDVFDYETDIRNPKKIAYESVLQKELHRPVIWLILLSSAPFLLFVSDFSLPLIVSLGLFWFFAVFYSAPPIRAKAKPFLDSFFSAGHYVATGVFGYFLVLPAAPVPWLLILAGMLWAIAMHVYSAVPDITADREAGLATTATLLTKRPAIWYCIVLYASSAWVLSVFVGVLAWVLFVPYAVLLLMSLPKTEVAMLGLYRFFPYLNALVGAVLTFYAFSINGWL